MGTKVKEIRPMTEQGRKTDPECSVCHPTLRGKVREDQVWEFVKAHPEHVNPWRHQPSL